MCAAQKKANTNEPTEVQQPSDKIEEGSEATASNGKRVRCSKTQFWLNFIEIFLLAWLFVFSTGIVVQVNHPIDLRPRLHAIRAAASSYATARGY
eukprot:1633928-Rhodomonas_salina.6